MAATRQAMSDSGSGLGAATCWQVRSDAVTVRVTVLSCRNVIEQRLCRRARLVRIEALGCSDLLKDHP